MAKRPDPSVPQPGQRTPFATPDPNDPAIKVKTQKTAYPHGKMTKIRIKSGGAKRGNSR